MTGAGVVADSLVKTYARGARPVTALAGVDLAVAGGEVVALVGPSGSGKSTLLALLCGWESPDSGVLSYTGPLAGRRPETLGWSELALVPQALGLVADLPLADNVLLPARLRGDAAAAGPRAGDLMAGVGIGHLAGRYPHETSLGEQQRAAVARALLLHPAVLLADEPTAHQDRGHADRLLDALVAAARAGTAVLLATHDEQALDRADRVLAMRDGRLGPRTSP
ncbi:putative ABC transport system ATP-binding protein [Geodermatophilus pulveris]|uniref:Putative ABC transport system ATP-binding protein n=1 Tax=Geodermatophilus pulveris TaxID=1564159 RepID=A0A239DAI0_9ACTN|nr:ATP-binding cassette domain-containing protein [Geodermatophilus pulveris]SNS29290.1 putative ABC transport system ATP-binding protein [Geodermatophilus pulveris]